MRATDIIRNVLDLIDQVDRPAPQAQITIHQNDEEESRFKQIFAQLSQKGVDLPYSNTPNEVVSGVDSVTTNAGGGVNGPKHPADIRIKDPRGFE
jgi:hypothetical protein